jgi:hypothetical protein
MSGTQTKKYDAPVYVSFWGSKQIDPYDLIISKFKSSEIKKDRKITTEKKPTYTSGK